MSAVPIDAVPKKIPRWVFRKIRTSIDDKLLLLEAGQALKVEGYRKNVMNAIRRWYLAHGYPNTLMRKGVLYISR